MPTKDFGRTLCVSLARTENRFTKNLSTYTAAMILVEK